MMLFLLNGVKKFNGQILKSSQVWIETGKFLTAIKPKVTLVKTSTASWIPCPVQKWFNNEVAQSIMTSMSLEVNCIATDFNWELFCPDPIRFHQFDVSSDVIVIIYSESSCRRILKTSEIWMADKTRNLCCWLLSALFLTRMSTVCHARKITATYLLLSVVHVFPLFWITRTYTTLYSITTGLQISLKTTTIFLLIDTTRTIFLYKFWSWIRLKLTSNSRTVQRRLFGVRISIFK